MQIPVPGVNPKPPETAANCVIASSGSLFRLLLFQFLVGMFVWQLRAENSNIKTLEGLMGLEEL
jgi:hypothetical protein